MRGVATGPKPFVPNPCVPCNPWLNADMEHEELTSQIIGAAHKVLYALKPGLDEKLYERAMVIELTAQGLRCESQKQFPVHYAGQHIGTLIPDLIVEGKILVDCKVTSAFTDTHLAQMLGYLNITGLNTALLLNFKNASLGIKRVANSR